MDICQDILCCFIKAMAQGYLMIDIETDYTNRKPRGPHWHGSTILRKKIGIHPRSTCMLFLKLLGMYS